MTRLERSFEQLRETSDWIFKILTINNYFSLKETERSKKQFLLTMIMKEQILNCNLFRTFMITRKLPFLHAICLYQKQNDI